MKESGMTDYDLDALINELDSEEKKLKHSNLPIRQNQI